MRCSRRDCENILCDKYNPKFGYICDDCFEELKLSEGRKELNLGDIYRFMETPKDNDGVIDLDELFQ